MNTPRYRRIATEDALLGSLSELHIAKHECYIAVERESRLRFSKTSSTVEFLYIIARLFLRNRN